MGEIMRTLFHVVSDLVLALVITLIPCTILGVIGMLIALYFGQVDNLQTKLMACITVGGIMLIYAMVDRVTLRAYTYLASYTYRTGRLHLNMTDFVVIFLDSWTSTDMRPEGTPRPRAYYYKH